MNCSSPRTAVWERNCFGLVAVCLPPYWIKWLSPNLSHPAPAPFLFRFEIYFKKRFLLLSKKNNRETVDPSTYLLCNWWFLVLGWWMRPTLSKIRRHVIGVSIIHLGIVISWSRYRNWRDWLRDRSCGYFRNLLRHWWR